MDRESVPLLTATGAAIPTDKYRTAYAIFVVQGVGVLLPWNAFISAADYFSSMYGASFVFFIPLVFNYACALCYAFTKVLPRFSFVHRVLVSIATIFIVLLVIPFLESLPRHLSATITLLGIFMTGLTSAIMQSSIAGMGALFPPEYLGGMMSGCGIAGMFAIALRIVTKGTMGDTHSGRDPSVVVFFMIAASVTIVCAITFVILWRLPITKHHINTLEQVRIRQKPEAMGESVNIKVVIRKLWKEAAVVIFTLFVTLSLFPGVTGLIPSHGHKFSADWFSIFMTALFMLFDFIGRTLPQWFRIFSPKVLLVPTALRVVFFPLLLFCIKPHLINSDIASSILISALALTNGYCSTLGMIYGPQQVSSAEKEFAGIIMSGCITVGIIFGSHFAFLMLYLIKGSIGI